MGVLFIRYPTTESYIACLKCSTPIVSTSEAVKPSEDGNATQSLHYKKIMNTTQGSRKRASKQSTFHFARIPHQTIIFRDINCITCKSRLGRYHEYSTIESQKWSEGTYAIQWKHLKIVNKTTSRPMTICDLFKLQEDPLNINSENTDSETDSESPTSDFDDI